jgi:hypothetical protein
MSQIVIAFTPECCMLNSGKAANINFKVIGFTQEQTHDILLRD